VTSPVEDTVATDGALDAHVMVPVETLPPALVAPDAVAWLVCPTTMVELARVTVTVASPGVVVVGVSPPPHDKERRIAEMRRRRECMVLNRLGSRREV
jgi:hypothetical protein